MEQWLVDRSFWEIVGLLVVIGLLLVGIIQAIRGDE